MLVRPGKQVSGLLPRSSHVGRGNKGRQKRGKGVRCIQGHIILQGGGVCVQSLQWVNSFLFKNFIQEFYSRVSRSFPIEGGPCAKSRVHVPGLGRSMHRSTRHLNLLGSIVGPAIATPNLVQPYHFSDAVNQLVSRDYLHVTWKA